MTDDPRVPQTDMSIMDELFETVEYVEDREIEPWEDVPETGMSSDEGDDVDDDVESAPVELTAHLVDERTPEERSDAARRAWDTRGRRDRDEPRERMSSTPKFPVKAGKPADVATMLSWSYDEGTVTRTLGRVDAEALAKTLIADTDAFKEASISTDQVGSSSRVQIRYDDGRGLEMTRRFVRTPTRDNPEGDLTVYHAWFSVPPHAQGTGIATDVLRSSFAEYEKLGVTKVTIAANVDLGAYAFARFGFLPKGENEWKSLRRQIDERVNKLAAFSILTDAQADDLRKTIASDDPATLWKIADNKTPLGRATSKRDTIGVAVLKALTWDGVFDMQNAAQISRFNHYVNPGTDARKASKPPAPARPRRDLSWHLDDRTAEDRSDAARRAWDTRGRSDPRVMDRDDVEAVSSLPREKFKAEVEGGVSLLMHRGVTHHGDVEGQPKWYASEKVTAEGYAKAGGTVHSETLTMKRPYVATGTELLNAGTSTVERLKKAGYDGMIAQWKTIATKSAPARNQIYAVKFDLADDSTPEERSARSVKAWDTRGRSEDKDHGGKFPKPKKMDDFGKNVDDIYLERSQYYNPEAASKTLLAGTDVHDFVRALVVDADGMWDVNVTGTETHLSLTLENREDGTVAERTIERENGQLIVRHDRFKVPPPSQGKGIAKDLLRSSFAEYERIGVDHVTTTANIDAGGYAWARFGFVPTPEAWDLLKEHIENRVEYLQLNHHEHRRIDEALQSDDPSAIWDLADERRDVEIQVEDTDQYEIVPLGKALLKDSNWKATFDMKNTAQIERFRSYVDADRKASTPVKSKEPRQESLPLKPRPRTVSPERLREKKAWQAHVAALPPEIRNNTHRLWEEARRWNDKLRA